MAFPRTDRIITRSHRRARVVRNAHARTDNARRHNATAVERAFLDSRAYADADFAPARNFLYAKRQPYGIVQWSDLYRELREHIELHFNRRELACTGATCSYWP